MESTVLAMAASRHAAVCRETHRCFATHALDSELGSLLSLLA
jgi:hypothetical protein